tara:strand:+ start:3905 stop:4168 length:264 start_codon:yes stop_codon:yes gene_type:complete
MITEDDEFKRIEREIKWRKEKAEADLMVVYSLRLTKAQRIKLLQLGGPQWIRNQIERSTKLRSLGASDSGQVRLGRLHPTSAAARST